MKTFKSIVVVILLALVLIFAVQNMTIVEVQFLTWSVSLPRSLLVIALLLVGFVLGWIISSFRGHRF
jgi:uncharacterized integral membrane protein